MKKIGNIFNFAFDFNSKIKIKIFARISNFNFLKKKRYHPEYKNEKATWRIPVKSRMRKLHEEFPSKPHEEFPSNQACCLNFRYLTKSLPRENLSN